MDERYTSAAGSTARAPRWIWLLAGAGVLLVLGWGVLTFAFLRRSARFRDVTRSELFPDELVPDEHSPDDDRAHAVVPADDVVEHAGLDDEAAVHAARERLLLGDALRSFAREHGGRPPETLDELLYAPGSGANAYVLGDRTLLDAWGTPYVYERTPTSSGWNVTLTMLGADRRAGGAGVDADAVLLSIVLTNP